MLKKIALNKYEKKLKQTMPIDEMQKAIRDKSFSLTDMSEGKKLKLNDYIREKAKQDLKSKNLSAATSTKKLPKSIKDGKTIFGKGTPTQTLNKDKRNLKLFNAKQRNARKQNFKSLFTPETFGGGAIGYNLGKEVSDNETKGKLFGTLLGAGAGNLAGRAARKLVKKSSPDINNLKNKLKNKLDSIFDKKPNTSKVNVDTQIKKPKLKKIDTKDYTKINKGGQQYKNINKGLNKTKPNQGNTNIKYNNKTKVSMKLADHMIKLHKRKEVENG
ncbi:MAG: hypothetical protein ACOCT9_01210 [archaeon]